MTAEITDFQEFRKKRDQADRVSASPDRSDHHDKTKPESSPSLTDALFGDEKPTSLTIRKLGPVMRLRTAELLSEEEKKKSIDQLRLYPNEVVEVLELSTGKVLEYS